MSRSFFDTNVLLDLFDDSELGKKAQEVFSEDFLLALVFLAVVVINAVLIYAWG